MDLGHYIQRGALLVPPEDTSAKLAFPISAISSPSRMVSETADAPVPLRSQQPHDSALAILEGERIRNLIWKLDCLLQTTYAQCTTAPRVLQPNEAAVPALFVPEADELQGVLDDVAPEPAEWPLYVFCNTKDPPASLPCGSRAESLLMTL